MQPFFSVIIPFFNEAAFLGDSFRSWMGQSRRPDEIILVDNGSTDGSLESVAPLLAESDIPVKVLADPRPGKINALETGCKEAVGRYIVLADADTLYPPHYLDLAENLLNSRDVVAVMAQRAGPRPDTLSERARRVFYSVFSRIASKQAFTGGYGQIIDADVLARAGGFSEERWPYVLLDHEIMHRVLRYGDSMYHPDMWCQPSMRRSDRSRVRWTLFERLLYLLTPFVAKDWFFYRFLGPRLAARGMSHLNLREKAWE